MTEPYGKEPSFYSRQQLGLKAPHNNDGVTLRPPLMVGLVKGITVHYTGARPIKNVGSVDPKIFMQSFQQIAWNSGKSYEYNYVIPPRDSVVPTVWEYAGAYRAAHSEGENHTHIGVVFLNGVTNHPSYSDYDKNEPTVYEPLRPHQIIAYQWLRDRVIVPIFTKVTEQIPHRQMPGAATPCPGDAIMAEWDALLASYNDQQNGDTMYTYVNVEGGVTLYQEIAPGVLTRMDPHTLEQRHGKNAVTPHKTLSRSEFDRCVIVNNLIGYSAR